MVARIHSFAFSGIDVIDVDVQVHVAAGLPAFTVVGLPDKAIAESRERVRSSLASMGLALPAKRITVNLSPADLLKEGSHFDLSIALGLLCSMDVLKADELEGFVVLGELALDGALSPISGVLPAALGASARGKGIICPAGNGAEAAWAGDNLDILAPTSLLALINHFKGTQVLTRPTASLATDETKYPDLSDVRGQQSARRALEIAASGGHNLLMMGPPGAGKSMLASRLPGIIPPPNPEEMLNISMIASVAGELSERTLSRKRPYRAPHHSCSMPAMVGGGTRVRPGEISLAHGGVLFLDELPEFPRQVLDALRQPLETGTVSIARAQQHITFPARFQLVGAMNPCRCGYLDDASRACTRAPKCAVEYQSKISGPLLDRFDIHIYVPAVLPSTLESQPRSESSAVVAERVKRTREIQRARYDGKNILLNAQADGDVLQEAAPLSPACTTFLNTAAEKMGLSMRGYHRVIRLARTIADMELSDHVQQHHLAESLGYRQMDFTSSNAKAAQKQ